jgi:hypothetical protein
MIGVVGTRWPARIDERVMQILLHVVYDPLFEIRRIVHEHPDAADRLVHDRFMTAAYGL